MNLKQNDKVLSKKLVTLSLVLYVVLVAINYMSAMGLINGISQGGVSAKYPTMITPAGFAFAIWGIIYLFMILALLSPIFKKTDLNVESIKTIAPLFYLSIAINIAWTLAFSYEIIWLSAILIILLLLNVFKMVLKIKDIRGEKKGFFDIGFGLYAGWLTIASLVNFMAFLVSINFGFFGNEKMVYLIALVVFLIVVLLLQKVHQNPFYNLSIAWAFFGIIKKLELSSFADPMFLILVVGIIALLVESGLAFRKMKFTI